MRLKYNNFLHACQSVHFKKTIENRRLFPSKAYHRKNKNRRRSVER
ncbi:hypothetical protein HMPREF7215_2661 [Pyramidobacter piscolens W5455]|uniref:Uncharacterized protein n=1 Tax=Pyramidobacter piscolens W5455 TaxID=352165 RepID=A0ABM9ZVI1_9BACT|nr:hypothetical protein HMPREF7215_2661 [Pyramidobacter piscolens W5455]